jgi:HAD superfamily hydrolase (TIGR01549 family)
MKRRPAPAARRARRTAFLFDLDGTLVDSSYEHTLAWRNALRREGFDVPTWKVHRRIGMSGGLISHAILTEVGRDLSPEAAGRVKEAHTREYERLVAGVHPLPGAKDLLRSLTEASTPWIIATSSSSTNARRTVAKLGLDSLDAVLTRDEVERAKPDPDLFLAAALRLDVPIDGCIVVGDSIWDIVAARRAGALGVGLLTGGYGRQELESVGALRVYDDPLDLLRHLFELGVRPSDGSRKARRS